MKKEKIVFILFIILSSIANLSCSSGCGSGSDTISNLDPDPEFDTFLPLSDPTNTGKWILNKKISDEFESTILDEEKWLIQGRNGEFQSNFKGRAPSQFSTDNVRLEDGKLMLETRWEPDYNYSPKFDKDGTKYENITTAAVIAKNEFVYGYLEIKSKAADAEITSSFWATGGGTEFDFFEMFGDHKQTQKEANGKERELWWSIHDWTSKGGGKTTYTEHHDLGFRVADDFHIYGYEWNAEELLIYIDGKLLKSVSKQEINAYNDLENSNGGNGLSENFIITKPIKVWFDQETFPWHGVPDSKEELGKDGQVDFEIEYIRIWQ